MSDLKWITVSFVTSLNAVILKEKCFTRTERASFKAEAKQLSLKAQTANTHDEVVAIHMALHDLGNKVCITRMRYAIARPK